MITVIYAGKLKSYNVQAIERAVKMSAPYVKIKTNSIAVSNVKNADGRKKEEAKKFLKEARGKSFICFDKKGVMLNSKDFADFIYKDPNKEKVFIIGGPDGLDEILIQKASKTLSLSSLTFSHALALEIITEQIYRAASIKNNLKFNR